MSALHHWQLIWTGLQHERHINWQDWQDIELARVLVFCRHSKSCSMLCSFLPWTGTGNMIPSSDNSSLIWPFCKNGNSGENGSTCVPFQRYWYWWRTWTGFLHECPSVRSVSMAKVQRSATWFQVATGFLEALSQLHQQPGQAHPNTRSEVSTRLKLSPLHWSDLWQD